VRVYQFRHTGLESQLPKMAAIVAPLFQSSMIFRKPGYHFSGSCSSHDVYIVTSIVGSRAGQKQTKASRPSRQNGLPGLHPSPGSAKCSRPTPEAGCSSNNVALMTEMAMKASLSEQLRRKPAVAAAVAIFALSTATLLGALYFQFVLKLAPCPLCLEQRLPYHIVIPLSLLMTIAAIVRAPRALLVVGFLAIMAAMLCSAALGAYHAGVEWHWWPGPTECSGPISDFTVKGPLLDQLQSIYVVRCDEPAWRFLGLSLAGYNALMSLVIAAIAAVGLLTRKDAT
jgi:disulfide bond formation protein DsbB